MRASIKVVLVAFIIASVTYSGGVFNLAPSVASASGEGIFVVDCGYSHRLADDPIVRPAQPGGSHNHDFFGNRSTNAFSTYESLRANPTNCRRLADRSAYWVPTLYDGGTAVRPWGMSAYYTNRGKKPGTIVPFPEGLRVVAGNAAATQPQAPMVTLWTCNNNVATESSHVPSCPAGTYLFLHVRFPDCWNGEHLDFPDHKSHMAYSMWGYCPAGYPVAVPGLQINVAWPVRGGPNISLSSGSAYTAHADFFNAWDQAVLEYLVRHCLNMGSRCV
jgi:hypothetical protein